MIFNSMKFAVDQLPALRRRIGAKIRCKPHSQTIANYRLPYAFSQKLWLQLKRLPALSERYNMLQE